ncbi:MAG: xanthine dehydrogenase family protein molybdopterin-binding subunit [Acetobacteraceae bacterium]|nr:xanthine dehydrogenase family protein molybdopterin-binding subunit [Acetobacteraceae bacterium]
MNAFIGQPISRVDGPAKVTGQATFAAEFRVRNLAHAALVTSTISKGWITAVDATEAQRLPGVLAIIWHENAPRLPYKPLEQRPQVDPQSGDQLRVFQGPEVLFNGQPIAVVVAETVEQARSAAALVEVRYAPGVGLTTMDISRGRNPSRPVEESGRPGEEGRGDAESALARAPVRIDITCSHEREHHNAIEPHATIAEWDGDHLTLYDKSQWVDNVRSEISHVFGIPEKNIRVVSPYVGGAFGSALRTWPHVTIAALAARHVRRPVRVELTRRELYTSIGCRPRTEQRVRLGAERDGTLTAIIQEAFGQTSTYEEYAEITADPPRILYTCPNVLTRYRLVDMNINSPCPMRAPGTASGVMAHEMAMDELAEALGMDPLELRLCNYAERDEDKNLPWSSKHLRECYSLAAERFDWANCPKGVAAAREGLMQVGFGMATAFYPSHRSAASAHVVLYANGTAVVRTAASDMGPGTYTAMTQIAADALRLPMDHVDFELGDTDMPKAPVHGGSITLASVGNAVAAACKAVLEKLAGFAEGGAAPRDLSGIITLMNQRGLEKIEADGEAKPGEETKKYSSAAFGAVFAEVHVDPMFGTVRVPRIVGAYDIGRVVNPKIARSQCIGGMVGGLGMALLEQAEWDAHLGRVMNANLAEYLVPVSADIQELEALFVDSEDTIFNPLGAKGVAEIALTGVAPAIANAVYNATGKRVRNLPITPERLLAGD